MKSYKDMIKEYLDSINDDLSSKNIIHEMNGSVLYKTNNAIFGFYGLMIDEVMAYCSEQGYRPDKIVFVSFYDINFGDINSCKVGNTRLNMKSDSKISIIEEDGLKIARVCICEKIDIKDNNKDER